MECGGIPVYIYFHHIQFRSTSSVVIVCIASVVEVTHVRMIIQISLRIT